SFVAKYDSNGTYRWSKRFGSNFNVVYSMAVDGSGNVVVAGEFLGTVDFGGGGLTSMGYDLFVAKYGADGTHLWSKRFGSSDEDLATSVAVDGSSDVIVKGRFTGSVDFGGGPLTSPQYGGGFVAKYDASGTHLWSKQIGSYSGSVAVD